MKGSDLIWVAIAIITLVSVLVLGLMLLQQERENEYCKYMGHKTSTDSKYDNLRDIKYIECDNEFRYKGMDWVTSEAVCEDKDKWGNCDGRDYVTGYRGGELIQ